MIPETSLELQFWMYFPGWMLPGAVSNMRRKFYRDYFFTHHMSKSQARGMFRPEAGNLNTDC
jgi:hypothetical protein